MFTAEEIKQKLQYLNPIFIDVRDDSYAHREHIENPSGGLTHATIVIVSDQFNNLSQVQRHKLVYSPLKEALAGSLHALSIKAYTNEEYTASF